MPAWPGGRVEGLEESKARMVIECREEAGVEIVIAKAVLLGECYFQRDGFPVTQYCFAVPALNGDYLKETKELRDISYISPKVFFEIVPDEGYFRNYHAFVNNAISIGMLLE
jgi:8-oxo-dGTP pyrophosphatase MutT (NUDIX family)